MTPTEAVASCDMDADDLIQRLDLAFQDVSKAQDHIAPLAQATSDQLAAELHVTPAVAASLLSWRDRINAGLANTLRFIDATRGVLSAADKPAVTPQEDEAFAELESRGKSGPPRLLGETEEEYSQRKAQVERQRLERQKSHLEAEPAMQKATRVWGS